MHCLYDMQGSHCTTLRDLRERVIAAGGNEDTEITIEADGEPVYIYVYIQKS